MASYRKLPSGKWRAEVQRDGVRRSNSFATKQMARDWAAAAEHAIQNPEPVGSDISLADIFDRYACEVSPLRKGEQWELVRLKKFCTYPLASVAMADLEARHFAERRDARLRQVAPASVAREMNLMSAVLTVARREWGLIRSNPMTDVRKPQKPPPRTRMPTEAEFEALALSAGDDLHNATARVFHAFLFACQTAMRAGEIIGLTWGHVDLPRRVAHLPKTKNGYARDVPLTTEPGMLLEALPEADPVFALDSAQTDALWRKLRDRAAVVDLRFHDSRRYATSWLSKKLDVLELAKMTGHRDIKVLLNTYYQSDPADVARKLD